MSTPFNPTAGLIRVWGELEGPAGFVPVRLLLDTGATNTLIGIPYLSAVGYGPILTQPQLPVLMGSGRVSVPVYPVLSLRTLGQKRANLSVGGHVLPPGANADGLLGLDFFRGFELNMDFRTGQITLA